MAELELSPEAKRLFDARKAAIAELKAMDGRDRLIGDADVVRVSNARLLVDALTMRMLSGGGSVSPSEFSAANALVDEALVAAGQRQQQIEVQFVEGVAGVFTCAFCHKRNEIPDGEYTPPRPPRAPAQIEGVVVAESKADAPPAAPKPELTPAQIEEAGRADYVRNHLKRLPGDDSWKNDVAPVGGHGGNPRSVNGEPHPYRNREAHRLPDGGGQSLVWSGNDV